MITYVICSLFLMAPKDYYNSVQAKGVLLSDNYETWTVDFTEYLDQHPKYQEFNNIVQFINNNECLYVQK